jgi:hypothetical protein
VIARCAGEALADLSIAAANAFDEPGVRCGARI